MTSTPPPVPTDALPPKPSGWVLHSTDESIEKGQISFCAVLEIFLAMALFGALAYCSPWPWFSLLGLMAAPLLLLRSPQSIEQGKTMLRAYASQGKPSAKQWLLIAVLVVAVTTYGYGVVEMFWDEEGEGLVVVIPLFLGLFGALALAGAGAVVLVVAVAVARVGGWASLDISRYFVIGLGFV